MDKYIEWEKVENLLKEDGEDLERRIKKGIPRWYEGYPSEKPFDDYFLC